MANEREKELLAEIESLKRINADLVRFNAKLIAGNLNDALGLNPYSVYPSDIGAEVEFYENGLLTRARLHSLTPALSIAEQALLELSDGRVVIRNARDVKKVYPKEDSHA